jgi:hypothetical protein
MAIVNRIVPNITSHHPELSRQFYVDFPGLRVAMDLGWITTYVSPVNPKAQITFFKLANATRLNRQSRLRSRMLISAMATPPPPAIESSIR